MAARSLRFADVKLQNAFLSELRRTDIPFTIESDTTVTCGEAEHSRIVDVAHKVRDSCFRWYFRSSDDIKWSEAFWNELKTSGLPFQVEYHDQRIVFLLPKGSEELHDEISDRAHDVHG